jgi:hypothetical protein
MGGSTVWDDAFETDQAALAEAMRSIEQDGASSLLGSSTTEMSAPHVPR